MGPVASPIHQTSTFRFETSNDAVRFANGDPDIYVYTRYHNPSVREVEETLALMEGAEEAALFSSGMAAITTAILSQVKPGDEILATPALYGGTYRWFRDELPKRGITVRWIDAQDLSTLPSLASPRTRIVYFETPTNPTLSVVDIREVVALTSEASRKHGVDIRTMIDNTFATILNQDPLDLGVDVIVESATKYLGGHSDIVAGVVLGPSSFLSEVRTLAKHHGGCIDPFAAYLLNRSLKTFELRVQRQNVNAFALATSLESHDGIERVIYPGLTSHPDHAIAAGQMKGYGGMVTVEVAPQNGMSAVDTAARVCDKLRVAVNAMSLGGVETLVSIPVYSSHIFMDQDELARHGVTPGMIRISVGVEHVDDLIEDFRLALKHA
jgi:cystathionine beta-lyase/cystathionine gamma-synthase